MQYLLDTVALIRHFTDQGSMGKKAAEVLNSMDITEDHFYVSVVSLMEIMYLAEKNRIGIDLTETLNLIEDSSRYFVVELNSDILRVAEELVFSELHDRLILATAKWLGIPIISSDSKFIDVCETGVVWD